MGYLEDLIATNERIEASTRGHWTGLVARIFLPGILLLIGIAIAAAGNVFGTGILEQWGIVGQTQIVVRVVFVLALIVYPLVAFVLQYMYWRNEQYVVTNYRVIHIHGVLRKTVRDSSLEKVNDIVTNQSVLGRLLDYGNLDILTSSEAIGSELRHIGKPLRFKTAILESKQRLEGSAAAGGRSVPQLLSELAELRDRGVITEDEFQREKKQLLDRM
jgi:uncharacterized membrane protein YdbT with pleckstrin-like domain